MEENNDYFDYRSITYWKDCPCSEITPMSDDAGLTDYLWPIVREMIKTAIENKQNLIIEGCYIPFDWPKDFAKEYLDNI